MGQPPQAQEQDQEESIQAGPIGDDRPFHVPATSFEVLESRFYSHTTSILLHAVTTSRPIGEQDPGFALLWVPDGTHRGGQTAIVPDQC